MNAQTLEQLVMLWMVNAIPARMVFAGCRWRVTDTPTRISHSIWSVSVENPYPLQGWRFQGTDDAGDSFVFDAYQGAEGWHVYHTYS